MEKYKRQSLISRPFSTSGKVGTAIKILALFLTETSYKKIDAITQAGLPRKGAVLETHSSSYFAKLSENRILQYNTYTKCWERGSNFEEYLGYVLWITHKDKKVEEIYKNILDDRYPEIFIPSKRKKLLKDILTGKEFRIASLLKAKWLGLDNASTFITSISS